MNMEYRSEDFLSYKLHMIKTNKFKTINVKVVFSNEINYYKKCIIRYSYLF